MRSVQAISGAEWNPLLASRIEQPVAARLVCGQSATDCCWRQGLQLTGSYAMRLEKLLGAAAMAAALMAAPAFAQDTTPSADPGAGSSPPPTLDTTGDGTPDAWDPNGDGKAAEWDTNGDRAEARRGGNEWDMTGKSRG